MNKEKDLGGHSANNTLVRATCTVALPLDERRALVVQLRNHLQGLIKRDLSPVSPENSFPTDNELNQVRALATKIFLALGRTRPRYDEGWSVFTQVEAQYSTVRLHHFCQRLMTKLEKLPVGPITRITQKLGAFKSTDIDSADKLSSIVKLLDQSEVPSPSSLPWRDHYLLLRPFVSESFEKCMIERTSDEQDYEILEESRRFYGVLGFAAYFDIWEQSRAWKSTHDPAGQVQRCRDWLLSLHSEDIETRLRNISRADSNAVPLAIVKDMAAKRKVNQRKRKSRAAQRKKNLR